MKGHSEKVLIVILLFLMLPWLRASTYYVDFENGQDGNPGTTQTQAWKHAPGDPQATKGPANVGLQPGDIVQFKGGVVYRGSVVIPADGTPGNRIIYRGRGWGTGLAILDGSEAVTGWQKVMSAEMAGGNPHFQKMYWTEIEADSPFLLNMHESTPGTAKDDFLGMAQDPNPQDRFFYDRIDSFYPVSPENLTRTSMTAPEVFQQINPDAYKGASLLLWVNPNQTQRMSIDDYDPETGMLTFAELRKNAIYGNRDQFFALYNSPLAIDEPGEFSVGEENDQGKRRLLLWPLSGNAPGDRVTRSVRQRGIDVNGHSHVEIDGFHIRKFAGAGTTDGCGIIANKGNSQDLWIRNNEITHNMSGRKAYGGIHLKGVSNSMVEDNRIWRVMNHRGIFLTSGCENVIVQRNHLSYTGTTALGIYTGKRIQILDNKISHIYATHANAITIYIASENILVAGNEVTEASNPITFQDSGPLYFIGNFTDGLDVNKNVNEWSNTSRGPWASGEIVFLHNSFVNAEKKCALNLGKDAEKTYVVGNNILDGLAIQVKKGAPLTHVGNLYTGLNSFQAERYGWELNDSEEVDEGKSPGKHRGVNVEAYLPLEVFPNVDFSKYLQNSAGRKAVE